VDLVVSVPCAGCNTPIGFGMDACAGCGAAVTRRLRRTLDERLEATGGEYRVLRERIRRAQVYLFGVGGFQLLATLAFGRSTTAVILGIALAALVLVGASQLERHPKTVIVAVVVPWTALQILAVITSPATLWSVFGKIVMVGMLGMAFLAARAAERIRKRIASATRRELKRAGRAGSPKR
jgi:cytochrome bd-type quinol oxidase subunit 2